MFQDKALRNLQCKWIQLDEIWAFVCAKNDNVGRAKAAPLDPGDVWTWTAICADTKLIASWYVGDRTATTAHLFIDDLRSRLAGRVQLTSDGLRAHTVVGSAFSDEIDDAVLTKIYGTDPVAEKHISTSHVERSNLSMRIGVRGFTRLTNAFSKKLENHACAVALHFAYYNFVRIHKMLRMTPAMAAGVTDRLFEVSDLVAIVEAAEPEPAKRGPYKIERHG
jgi:IS1 family transposase